MSEFEVVRVTSAAEMAEALTVRRAVFIVEQGIPESEEIDRHDVDPGYLTGARHVLVRYEGQPVGTGRLLQTVEGEELPHIGRVAVLASYRGRGAGRAVMSALHDLAREQGYRGATLSAQAHALGFYEKLGYVSRGGRHYEVGIEHQNMDLLFAQ